MRKLLTGAVLAFTIVTTAAGGSPAGAEPNCVEFFDVVFGSEIANHGQHILGDYITGIGHDGEWPYAGQVGDIVGGRGPANAGAPGIKEHGAAPGASFCNSSESPTSPPGQG